MKEEICKNCKYWDRADSTKEKGYSRRCGVVLIKQSNGTSYNAHPTIYTWGDESCEYFETKEKRNLEWKKSVRIVHTGKYL